MNVLLSEREKLTCMLCNNIIKRQLLKQGNLMIFNSLALTLFKIQCNQINNKRTNSKTNENIEIIIMWHL